MAGDAMTEIHSTTNQKTTNSRQLKRESKNVTMLLYPYK